MTRHRFHGDPARFDVVARFIADRFPDARYIADVAGGQGMLTRTLRKRFGFEAEVIDPRGWALKGVPARTEFYTPAMADYYDLIVGLHPDQALRSVVESAAKVAVLVVPSDYFDEAERETRTREWGLPPGQLAPYIRALWDHATTPNGVLGSKLMWNDFDWLRSSLRPPAGTDAGVEFTRTTFPNPRLPRLEARDLPPVRYRKQADSLTERYVDLVRSAMTPGEAQRPAPGTTG
jgi:hypothetical protein